jgi:peptide/nickel transport system permease protein
MAGAKHGEMPGRRLAALWRRLSRFERVVSALFVAIVAIAVIGPWLAPYPTTLADPAQRLLPPGAAHWFGTDENGMDVFSRLIAAPRTDVTIALVATALSVLIGAPLGVLAGFFEGNRRRVAAVAAEGLLRLTDVLQAFPVFILAMVLVAIRGTGAENVIIAVAFVNFPVFLRLVRSEVLSLRERLFAEAARAIGRSDLSLAFTHLLPNAIPTVVVQLSVTVGFAVLLTAGLSFVGAGVSPPTPELGAMIASGAKFMVLGQWWASLFPGIALGVIVFTFAIVGEILGRALEPVGSHGPASGKRRAIAVSRATARHAAATQATTLLAVEKLRLDSDGGSAEPLLKDIDLQVPAGEVLGVVGAAGTGKSLLLRVMLGLAPRGTHVGQGRVLFDGNDMVHTDPAVLRSLRGAAIAPILPNAKAQLNPLVRIGDLMVAHIRAHESCGRNQARQRAAEALRQVGIADAERRLMAYPHELSGGMAQRVCIALALLHRPRLLIADEPTAGLDVTVQRQVLDLMVGLARERGVTQVIATRDLGIVAHYCSRVAVLAGGAVVEIGPVRDVLGAPRHAATRQLIEASRGRSAP